MAPRASLRFVFYLAVLLLSSSVRSKESNKRVYLVLVDPQSKPDPFPTLRHWYVALLRGDTRPEAAPLLHRYVWLLHGFSATLTPSHAHWIERSRGILAVHRDYVLHPHITRSPSFLGLDLPASRLSAASRRGADAIIGVVDTGVWPEHPSFADAGLGPVPQRWRGTCEVGDGFNHSCCNRKLVGARFFSAGYAAAFGGTVSGDKEFWSARDSDGHGTHVASIAGGSPVAGAGFVGGFAAGVARGVAPRARVAAYKVCWAAGCLVSDIVAAIERAVVDGVDVISLSLGSSSPAPLYSLDPLAIATFRASLRGIFIASSAGNGGPHPGTIANAPPWITTVGAGTIDRDFPAVVLLGNGESVRGVSISIPPSQNLSYSRLLSAGVIASAVDINIFSGQIDGRIVLWEADRHVSRIEIGEVLRRAGAVGMVVDHGDVDPEGILAEPHVLPTVAVGPREARLIEAYIEGPTDPTATISSEGTILQSGSAAAVVASFSARGPNVAAPWVLKPDLVAPGVNILGAWTGAIGPAGIPSDIRRPTFNIQSGSSMACPHVSGVAAMIRAARPEWGPWEIRSALMTTAVKSPVRDEQREQAGPFSMGAGYLRPEKALNPGLVYDLEYEDYARFLCGLNYTNAEIKTVGGKSFKCGPLDENMRFGFNYPGFVVSEEEVVARRGEVAFYRRLKQVDGGTGRWYTAEVAAPVGYEAEVAPRRLRFGGKARERLEFSLVIRRITQDNDSLININEGKEQKKKNWRVGGMLRWQEEGGSLIVGCPIVVFSAKYL